MEFLVAHEDLVGQQTALPCKLLDFLLLGLITGPVRVLSAAHVLLVLLAQRLCDGPLHGLVCAGSTDVGLEVLALDAFLVVLEYPLLFNPKLVLIIILETVLR